MKAFIAIDHTHPDHHKYADFDTMQEARDHVTNNLPNGFAAADPGGGTSYWVVDAEAQTVTNNQDQADVDALTSSWERLRTERNTKLVESDWTQYNDSPLDEAKAEWAVYRQLLRDLPENTNDPADPTWPTPPA